MFDFSCASFVFYHPHTQYTSTDRVCTSSLPVHCISVPLFRVIYLVAKKLWLIYSFHVWNIYTVFIILSAEWPKLKKYTQIWIYIITSVHCFFAPTPSFSSFDYLDIKNLIEIVHSCQIFHYFWQWNKRIPFSPHFHTNCYNYKKVNKVSIKNGAWK